MQGRGSLIHQVDCLVCSRGRGRGKGGGRTEGQGMAGQRHEFVCWVEVAGKPGGEKAARVCAADS